VYESSADSPKEQPPNHDQGTRANYRQIHVIINPAAGRQRAILGPLNSVFEAAGVDWTVSVTKNAGDAYGYARTAMASNVDAIAVYGGDGTLMEVAAAMVESDLPLGILPGGTANALALTLGIPHDLARAAQLACGIESDVRTVDVGQFQEGHFLVAIGIGIPGILAESSDRQEKNRFGLLSYAFRSLQATREAQVADYHIRLDGELTNATGVACIIANSGNFGLAGIRLAPNIRVDDGLLDVIMIRDTDIETILSLATSVVRRTETSLPFQHWQSRRVTIEADPPQPIQADGETVKPGTISASVLPQAINLIVPHKMSH
jgi:YegS/Rv2252/BmrU family lipid kinase